MTRLIELIKKLPLWAASSLAALAFIITFIGIGIYADATLYNFTEPNAPSSGRGLPDSFYATFLKYDGDHYKNIANNGYTALDTAFFPLYPLLVKGVSYMTGISVDMALFVISFAFLVASAIVVSYWIQFELKKRRSKLSHWTVLSLIAFFPTSFYLALGYTESLFIFVTIASLFAFRRGHYWLAAAFIALATATRVQGGALAIFFLLEYVMSRKWHDWKKLIPVFAAPIGLVCYMIYLTVAFGNPFEFIAAQQNWGRLDGNIITNLISSFRTPYLWYLPVLGIMLWSVWRYLGKTWFVYCLIFILIPLSSGRLDSINRYIVGLPPLFLALSLYLETKPIQLRMLFIGSSIFLLAWNILLFTNTYWVG
jgi:Gpi18-like mannosyltransferase